MSGFMENGHVDTGDTSNGSGRHPPSPPQSTSASPSETKVVDRFTCFLCHGRGHWARDCTSLPAVYLVENPPRCYICGGIGHYARFCPSCTEEERVL